MNKTFHFQSDSEVLILGCGDLGTRVGQHFADQSKKVLGVRRRPMQAPSENFHFAAVDIHQPDALESILTDSLQLIIVTLTPDAYTEAAYKHTYYQAMHNLVNALQIRNASPHIIFVSSTSVYEQHSGEILDETSITEPQAFNGRWLLAAEQCLTSSGLPTSIVRLSGIYSHTRRRFLDKCCLGELPSPHKLTNRIHIEDAAQAIIHIAHLPSALAPEIFLVSDSEPATSQTIYEWLLEKDLCRRPDKFTESVNNDFPTSGKFISNKKLLASGFRFKFPTFREGYEKILRADIS
jgi:nucleoside-diphosphate-sugar epimerase